MVKNKILLFICFFTLVGLLNKVLKNSAYHKLVTSLLLGVVVIWC
jgi:hypothetical protein